MKNTYVAPEFKKVSFTCPNCGVLAKQEWSDVTHRYYSQTFGPIHESMCTNDECKEFCLWIDQKMVIPDQEGVAYPNDDLDDSIKVDYLEARSIISKSPRGSAALLRLAIQKLCKQLGEPGENINIDIASLVEKGLRPSIQKALDIVRVTGNESVHPGVIDLNDNREVALKLFDLVNLIAEVMISEPKRIDELYEIVIPEDKKKAISERDKKEEHEGAEG